MKQYSRGPRERALRQVDAGRPVGEVAALFGVHRAPLPRWRQRRELGAVAPRPRPGRAPAIGPAQQPRPLAQVSARPDATLAAHGTAWVAGTGATVSESPMRRALRRLGRPLEKRR